MLSQSPVFLAFAALSAAPALALIQNAPRATDTASDGPNPTGWTPKPTTPPLFSGHSGLRLGKRQASDTLLAEETICGWYSGIAADPFSCAAGNACYYNTLNSAFGCCSTDTSGYFIESDCNYINTVSQCYDYTNIDQCTGQCAYSQDTCGSTAPYCASALLFLNDGQVLTHFACLTGSEYRVFSVDPTTTDESSPPSSTTSSSTSTKVVPNLIISTTTTSPTSPISNPTSSPTFVPTPETKSKPSHTGAIVGGVIGGLAVIAAAAAGAIFYLKSKKKNQLKSVMPEVSQM